MGLVSVSRKQIRQEQEEKVGYRKALKWVVLAVEQGIISKEDIIEYVEAALLREGE
ncbi:hypothetical protein LCGC14_2729520 [marine sediment metagenome]|uniref:Uncharacterized protein n=1 Tax=marine sediment metagenome TaxID=412755 RepID=A0A0F8Z7P9_9ZZZZ